MQRSNRIHELVATTSGAAPTYWQVGPVAGEEWHVQEASAYTNDAAGGSLCWTLVQGANNFEMHSAVATPQWQKRVFYTDCPQPETLILRYGEYLRITNTLGALAPGQLLFLNAWVEKEVGVIP